MTISVSWLRFMLLGLAGVLGVVCDANATIATLFNIKATYSKASSEPGQPALPGAKDFDFWVIRPRDPVIAGYSKNGWTYEDKGTENVEVGNATLSARRHRFVDKVCTNPVQEGLDVFGCVSLPGTVAEVLLAKAWFTDEKGEKIDKAKSWGFRTLFIPKGQGAIELAVTNMSGFAVDITDIVYGDAITEPTLMELDPDDYVPPGGWIDGGDILGLSGSGYSQYDWQVGYGGEGSVLLAGAGNFANLVVRFDIYAPELGIYAETARIIMTPEPGTILLLAAGGSVLVRRRRG